MIAVSVVILAVIGLASLLIAPRLINMQGETSGIAVSLSVAAIAAILAVALATAAIAALFLPRRTTRNSGSARLHTPAAPAARTRAVRPLAPSA